MAEMRVLFAAVAQAVVVAAWRKSRAYELLQPSSSKCRRIMLE